MNARNLFVTSLVAALMMGALLLAKSNDPSNGRKPSGLRMTQAARAFLVAISAEQRRQATFGYDDAERLNWHFIPRPRKGLPLKAVEGPSLAAAHELIASGLSAAGYDQALNVMSLEEVLYVLEGGDRPARRLRRDPTNYFLSVFGAPSDNGVWGWRIEGHHLSLNYTVSVGAVVASTPEFFGANPGTVDAGPGRSIRVLAAEEDLAREILRACTPDQKQKLLLDAKAPDDIRDAGTAQPNASPPVGLAASEMTGDQRTMLKQLLGEYLRNMPADVRAEREAKIESAGFEKIRLAWWGSPNRDERHYYRVQGPTFLIEYNNTQNNANHVHSVWRTLGGDFNLPNKTIAKE